MLTKPNSGWTLVCLNEEQGLRASYLTDVPNDLMEAMIHALEHHSLAICEFDAEGFNYYLIMGDYKSMLFIDTPELKNIEVEKGLETFAKELIFDIESNLELWEEWVVSKDIDTHEEINAYKEQLTTNLNKLKGLIN